MKVLGILLIICASKAYSAANFGIGGNIGGKVLGTVEGTVKITVDRILCDLGSTADIASNKISSACTDLPAQNGALGPVVKSAIKTCTLGTRTVGYISNKLKKLCPNGSITSTQASTISSTSTKAPTTPSTSTPAPTTQTTQTPGPTTPRPCTKEELAGCDRSCQKYFDYSVNFGGTCEVYRGFAIACGCKYLQDDMCETYKNATCKQQCKNLPICRVPSHNLDCVCKIGGNGSYQYRLPNSTTIQG